MVKITAKKIGTMFDVKTDTVKHYAFRNKLSLKKLDDVIKVILFYYKKSNKKS